MKHKKLFAFMIIVSTLLVCCTMSISAENVWEDNEGLYEIDTFTLIEELTYIAENSEDESGYIQIYSNNIFILYQPNLDISIFDYKTVCLDYDIDKYYWLIYIIVDQSTSIKISTEDLINEYPTVYISKKFYDEIANSEFGSALPWETIVYVPKAKEAFDGTLQSAIYTIEKTISLFYYENNITFIGWIALISIIIPILLNIIKLITNSIKR